jgi:hypothetical protein
MQDSAKTEQTHISYAYKLFDMVILKNSAIDPEPTTPKVYDKFLPDNAITV